VRALSHFSDGAGASHAFNFNRLIDLARHAMRHAGCFTYRQVLGVAGTGRTYVKKILGFILAVPILATALPAAAADDSYRDRRYDDRRDERRDERRYDDRRDSAFDEGYRRGHHEGLREASRDSRRDDRYQFRDGRYRDGDTGYRRHYGSRGSYIAGFRRGYQVGYDRGYEGRHRGWERDRVIREYPRW
jgi:Ni/Co efflux regulator RcnB